MPRILHAYKVYRPEIEGGIPAIIRTLVEGLGEPFRHQLLVARRHGRGRRDDIDGVPVRRVASLGTLLSLPLAPGYPAALARAASGADLVAMHAPFPLGDAGLLLVRDRPVVVHWHAEIARQRWLRPIYRPALQRMLTRAAAIVVAHPRNAATSVDLAPHADRIRVVPYGLDPAPWLEETPAFDGPPRGRPLFVAVGRLVGYKGYDILIRAAKAVEAEVVICGTGADEPALRRQIAAADLGDRVRIEGFVPHDRLKRLLKAARALVLPSITTAEAFGLVQVEAMFCGRAVINTALPTAVPWVARDGREALTVPPADAAALAGAMQRLAGDPALATGLGRAGRERALARFSAAAFCAAIGDVYAEVLAGAGRA
jgi:rhamnosyl/mannosyltransferase